MLHVSNYKALNLADHFHLSHKYRTRIFFLEMICLINLLMPRNWQLYNLIYKFNLNFPRKIVNVIPYHFLGFQYYYSFLCFIICWKLSIRLFRGTIPYMQSIKVFSTQSNYSFCHNIFVT